MWREIALFPQPHTPHPHNNSKRPPCCLIHCRELSIIVQGRRVNLFRKQRFFKNSIIPVFLSSSPFALASTRSLCRTSGSGKWHSTACHRDENVGRSKSGTGNNRRRHHSERDNKCGSIMSLENFLCEINKAMALTFLATIILFFVPSSEERKDRKGREQSRQFQIKVRNSMFYPDRWHTYIVQSRREILFHLII